MFYISWDATLIAAAVPTIVAGIRASNRPRRFQSAWECGLSSAFWSASVLAGIFLVVALFANLGGAAASVQPPGLLVLVPLSIAVFVMLVGTIPAVIASALMLSRGRIVEPKNQSPPKTKIETGNPYQPPHD